MKPSQLEVLKKEFPEAWFVSAILPVDIQELREKIVKHFEIRQRQVKVHIPFTDSRVIGEIRRVATVIAETYDERGTILDLYLKPADLSRLRSHFPGIVFAEKSPL